MKGIKSEYSLVDKIKLAWFLLRTKMINPRIRIVRFPLYIRGKKYIDFGQCLSLGVGCRFDVYPSTLGGGETLVFGSNVQLNDYVHIVSMERVTIGDNVLMASHIFISDNSHGSYKGDEKDSNPNVVPIKRDYVTAPVKIGNNVWIGDGVTVMPGVTIGEGSVIGAHSIISKDIPAFSIAVGSPLSDIISRQNTGKEFK